MILLIFCILILLFLLISSFKVFLQTLKNHKVLGIKKTKKDEFIHNSEHVAISGLIVISSIMLISGMIILFFDQFIFDIVPKDHIINFLSGSIGVFAISNMWFLKHIEKEENGDFTVFSFHKKD